MGAPSGTVGFLFTDIEGSTQLWDEVPDAMGPALERHDTLLHAAVESRGGHVFSISGDGFGVAFERVGDAFGAAVEIQEGLASDGWSEGAVVRARMGVHVGEGVERDGNYFGTAVNRAARLMSVAHGGQVVCSQAAAPMVGPDVVLLDLGEHRLRDLAAAETIFQVGDGSFPPLRSVDAVPTNLPTLRTELIGRSEQVEALVALVQEERLVTLTGTGGVGKTRLSLAVAGSVSAVFPDGCWLVELAPVADGGEVVAAVAGAMRTSATTEDALVEYLSDRRVLLVLDNCEHLLDATADLVDAVLAAGADVHVVTTSREPLGLDGECVRRIRSLELPEAAAVGDEIRSAAAVRLFVDRARAAGDHFTLDDGNTAAVVEICRHLDGIPLAIELAAARVRAMTPEEIATRLDERFRLLAGGSRRSQERHRTLQAAVAWSHDLLTEDERVLFRRLAVFPASFDLGAAEAVIDVDGDLDAVDGVLRLVDRSLVAFDPDSGRYRMLETLRQYAADRLVEAGEADRFRVRQARHFLEFAAAVAPDLDGQGFASARRRIALELDNLRACADWCQDAEEWGALADLCEHLSSALFQDAPVDYLAWLDQAVAHGEHLAAQQAVDLAGALAMLWTQMGDFEASERFAEQSHALARAGEGLAESAGARAAQAQIANYSGRNQEAQALAELALTVAEAREDELNAGSALAILMSSLVEVDELERWEAVAAEIRRRAADTGHPIEICTAALSVAAALIFRDDGPHFAAALEVMTADVSEPAGDMNDMWLDIFWGVALLGVGEAGAGERLGRAARVADRLRSPLQLDVALTSLAIAAAESGRVEQAEALVHYAEAELSSFRLEGSLRNWLDGRLDETLPDRDASSQEPVLSRTEVMALVGELDQSLD